MFLKMKPKLSILFTLFVIALLMLLFSLSGCITEKKRQKICNSCPVKIEKERHDSIITKTVYKTVKVPGKPGPVVYLENPCKMLCDSAGKLKQVNINTIKNGQTVTIKTQGNGLNITTETKDHKDSVAVTEKESFSSNKTIDTVIEKCARDHRTSFDNFCRWFFFIVSGCAVLFALIVLRRYI